MSSRTRHLRGPRAVIVAVIGLMLASAVMWIPALAEDDPVVGSAMVVNTDGEGVNMREHPWVEADPIMAVPEGTVVDVLKTALFDDGGMEWWKIRIGGQDGYSVAQYLDLSGSAPPPTGASAVGTVAGQVATVTATDGQGLNLRENPWVESPVITSMPEGTVVTVLKTALYDDSGMEWWKVSFEGTEGYSVAQYLAVTGQQSGSSAPPAPAVGLQAGQAVMISATGGDGVNVRTGAGVDNAVVGHLAEGTILTIVAGPVYDSKDVGWYQLTGAGVDGWVHGGYVAAAPPTGVVTINASGVTGSVDWLDSGDAIVTEAMSHLGAPYLWAGTTPAGFDCSGFVYYVVNRVLTNDFPRAIEQQMEQGTAVDWPDLRPGDLVFFENTYKEGLSHVGIYLGEGQFVSAGGEEVVVGVDSLNDSYWSTRYVTARRVGG